jgi:hypothetical protein
MPSAPRQQCLLEIEAARMRHAWAKAQLKGGDSTPALTKYLEDSSSELAALATANSQIIPSRLDTQGEPTKESAVKCVQCGVETELHRADVPYCIGCIDRSEQDRQENSGTALLETDKRRFEQRIKA